MTPAHHPDAGRLFDYAAGSLGHSAHLVIGAHVHACAECASAVAAAEAAGGILLDSLAPTPLAPEALVRAMAKIERPAPRLAATPAAPLAWIDVPAEVVLALRRRRRIAPGVWLAPVTRARGADRAYLMGIPAGVSMPNHTHRGWEMTVVLKGAFRDGETLYRAGDFCETDETVRHHPAVTNDEDCVCLAATQSSLVGLDLLSRVLIPLLGL